MECFVLNRFYETPPIRNASGIVTGIGNGELTRTVDLKLLPENSKTRTSLIAFYTQNTHWYTPLRVP